MGKPKVAVIGAGPCGIFSSGAIGDTADVTIFERASVMGGQWAFSEEKLVELDRQHSRYENCDLQSIRSQARTPSKKYTVLKLNIDFLAYINIPYLN